MSFSEPSDPALEDESTVHYYPPDDDRNEPLLPRLVCALAALEERSPESYDSGLHRLVDLDALERLFAPSAGTAGQVVLAIDGTEVRVNSDGSFMLVE